MWRYKIHKIVFIHINNIFRCTMIFHFIISKLESFRRFLRNNFVLYESIIYFISNKNRIIEANWFEQFWEVIFKTEHARFPVDIQKLDLDASKSPKDLVWKCIDKSASPARRIYMFQLPSIKIDCEFFLRLELGPLMSLFWRFIVASPRVKAAIREIIYVNRHVKKTIVHLIFLFFCLDIPKHSIYFD